MRLTMNNEVRVSDSGKYIIVQINTDMTRSLAEQLGIEAIQLGKRNKTNRYFYDLRNSINRETVNANYIYAKQEVQKIEPSYLNKIAMLVSPNDKSHDFVETVLRNAGHNVLIFNDEEKALGWLLEETEIL
jgi:3-deoxy-D-manno-octulosonate 8-phosphate phosphatase KdsC-like HAD superfamily phosphatase